MGKNSSNKQGQNFLDSPKKPTTDAIKTASKSDIRKTAEGTGDLIGNKIADKILSASKKSAKELPKNETEKDIYIQKKENKLLKN